MSAARCERIFLGSSSKARRNILRALVNPDIEVCQLSSDVPELRAHPNVFELVKQNTQRKTEACLKLLEERDTQGQLLVCGDCVVVSKNGSVFNKPKSLEEALKMLDTYDKDKWLGVVQAVEITRLDTGERYIDTEKCACVITGIPLEGRETFLLSSGAMHAAGGIIIEDEFVRSSVSHYENGSKESIMGLSVDLVKKLVIKTGYAHVFAGAK